jgi:hypothetical protein
MLSHFPYERKGENLARHRRYASRPSATILWLRSPIRKFGPLTAELKSLGKFEIDNIVAEGNYVVVQGHVTGRVTQTGQQYNK